ncbi:phosphotransferase [Ilumatobacter sp.]|uniref:phosphotransferase n=1 Tax=Ilumatobacter sp. TaxID=1967498 RepID=UPI003B52A4AB
MRCVWENELGGLTFEIVGAGRFLKWAPPGSTLPPGSALWLLEEAERLRWTRPHTPVPEVLDAGTADDGSTWLLTAALDGTTAVAERWKASPRVAVRAIGEGLRAFHESLPVARCPFTWTAEERLGRARARADAGLVDPAHWHPSHRHLTVDEAMAIVAEPPPVDRLVVCHADSCAPNTLIGEDGRWSGHVDLGRMGIGDRWADLAVATWSTGWNYGPGWEDELLAAYGIGPDPDRTRHYRLLWDLTD